MTVEVSKITAGPFTGNGITTTFPYQFRIERNEQLLVFETDLDGNTVELTYLTDYTVDGVGEDVGEVTRTAGPLPTGYTWYIRSNYQPTQETAFSSQGAFFPAIHEGAFDKLTYLFLQSIDQVNRAFRLPDSFSGTVNLVLPAPVPGAYLRWSNDGQSLINDTDITVIINISGAVQTVANIADEVVDVSGNMATISTVGNNMGAITYIYDNFGVLMSVNANMGAIFEVNSNLPAITGVNTNMGVVEGVYDDLGTINNVNANMSSITSVNANMSSITGVMNSLPVINNVWDNYGTIFSVNQSLPAINNVNDNMGTIEAAPGAADRAEAAAEEAELMTALYLNAASSDPSVGKDGVPLVAGNWYINTVTGFIRAYDGSNWTNGIAGAPTINYADVIDAPFDIESEAEETRPLKKFLTATFSDVAVDLGDTGTAMTIPVTEGGYFKARLTGNVVFTLDMTDAIPDRVYSAVLDLTNDGTAGRSVAWTGGGSTVHHPGGSLTRTTQANRKDRYFITCVTPSSGSPSVFEVGIPQPDLR